MQTKGGSCYSIYSSITARRLARSQPELILEAGWRGVPRPYKGALGGLAGWDKGRAGEKLPWGDRSSITDVPWQCEVRSQLRFRHDLPPWRVHNKCFSLNWSRLFDCFHRLEFSKENTHRTQRKRFFVDCDDSKLDFTFGFRAFRQLRSKKIRIENAKSYGSTTELRDFSGGKTGGWFIFGMEILMKAWLVRI